jgi:hypothetical protein
MTQQQRQPEQQSEFETTAVLGLELEQVVTIQAR